MSSPRSGEAPGVENTEGPNNEAAARLNNVEAQRTRACDVYRTGPGGPVGVSQLAEHVRAHTDEGTPAERLAWSLAQAADLVRAGAVSRSAAYVVLILAAQAAGIGIRGAERATLPTLGIGATA